MNQRNRMNGNRCALQGVHSSGKGWTFVYDVPKYSDEKSLALVLALFFKRRIASHQSRLETVLERGGRDELDTAVCERAAAECDDGGAAADA